MLKTRLWMGAILIALSIGVLVLDDLLPPGYPFLFVLVLLLSLIACYELHGLLDASKRPPLWLSLLAVTCLLVANWAPDFFTRLLTNQRADSDPWHWIIGSFTVIVLLAFLVEMATFRGPGESITRIALTIWIAAYLGVLPCFLVQLRWPGEHAAGKLATVAVAFTIFVPKCGDIGAYFTGRILGRHQMSPVLSPKKTWEGAAGGLLAAVIVSMVINSFTPVVKGGIMAAAGLGLALGVAGMLGDLAESLIKRDCQRKDASHVVPGFGGVLDIVDAILFAAPVSYCWLK